jgi:hypothetical protein
MTFNNTINHLKLWCINKAKAYQQVYGNYGGITYVGYQVAYEMEFKLSTLINKSFDSVADLKREVVNLIDVHYEPSVLNPQNSLAKHIIDKTNREFCEFLEDIFAKSEALTLADIPYARAIVGAEATTLQDKFCSVWGYVNTSYWFPLMGDHPKEISEKFFIMYDYFEPYMKQVEQIIGLPQTHIYCYGEEDVSRPPNCLEIVEINEYGGCETIYTDKDFTWAIYFSHENTVAFAGSIVPKIKELLSNESEHWNEFEWDLG